MHSIMQQEQQHRRQPQCDANPAKDRQAAWLAERDRHGALLALAAEPHPVKLHPVMDDVKAHLGGDFATRGRIWLGAVCPQARAWPVADPRR